MADNYGTNVSRVLDPQKTQFTQVVWQENKPPLDSELNALQQLASDWRKTIVSRGMPSGWIGSGVNDGEAFITDPAWSNWFRYGQQKTGEQASVQWAAVNGWLVPVTGTLTGTPPGSPDNASTWNRVTLGPPPSNSGDSRVDFVFLEVWQALLSPSPLSTNKPSASAIYRYGNVEGGMSYLSDDMKDPALGFETSKRVQVQYRVRVVSGLVGLQSFPDGFDPANVKARGAAATDTAYAFTNMRQELGDPGLWRAGDGSPNALGTVDGYSYAIPLCVVFRRNSVAWDGDPGQNLNGGFNRNPTAIDRTGWKTFTAEPTVAATMTAAQLTLTLSTATNIPLPAAPSTPVYIQVGDEILTYSSITGTTVTIAARGQLGTKAETHAIGETVRVLSGRPDGLFSDQITHTDILDLRHVVNPNGFDYNTLLKGNLDKLLKGQLRANWKRSGAGPIGTWLNYQDKISSSPPALGVSKLDAPDNIRQIWSSASVLQPVTFLAKPPTGTTTTESITSTWDLSLTGTCNNFGGVGGSFKNGAVLTIPVAQFKTTVPGSDQDQVSFPATNNATTPWVTVRVSGSDTDLDPTTDFSVATPSGPNDDLVITLNSGGAISVPLHITLHVQYGPSRGLSRRPDLVHGVSYLNASSKTLLRQRGTSANNIPLSISYAPLWSKFRDSNYLGSAPVTAEAYIDPGSQTVVLTPFRKIDLPNIPFHAIQNDTVNSGEGPMPNSGEYGGTIDPLNLFSSGLHYDSDTTLGSTYFVLPRKLLPGFGDVHVPIRHTDTSDFVEGAHFGFYAGKGLPSGTTLSNIIPNLGARLTTFTTLNLNTDLPQTFNTSSTYSGLPMAGIRHFTDATGLGRTGLQICPFYGIAKLFAVYEAADYKANGSNYNTDRTFAAANSTNLLRQDVQGPTFYIVPGTINSGDATFVINSAAIKDYDTSKDYVIEADIWGFDRGTFSVNTGDARVVLTRERPDALDAGGIDNVLLLDTEFLVVPAPPQAADGIAINFSRSAYQGDAYMSALGGQDVPQLVGPLTSGNANQIGYTELDVANLARKNEKALTVLASVGFLTTLGTGRVSGDYDSSKPLDWRNPGFQNMSAYPPASPVAARPILEPGVEGPTLGTVDELLSLGTEMSGCLSRLPLGGLFRDHDFRGGALGGHPLGMIFENAAGGVGGSLSRPLVGDTPTRTTPQASGAPGEIVVHMDGESSTGNWTTLYTYRTTRGGSAYSVAEGVKGGDLSAQFSVLPSGQDYGAVLVGVAYLVLSSPTNVGATEVNAGSEIQMLVCTHAAMKSNSSDKALFMHMSSVGTGEGYAAADLFRVSGRPLINSRGPEVNPATVALPARVSYKP